MDKTQDTTGSQSGGARQLAKEPSKDPRTQAEKFAAAAREHGASDDEEAFKGVLRKLSHPTKRPAR